MKVIPGIIHYCWFGNEEIPEEVKVYIKEWENLNPGWQFVFWNEENSPMNFPYMQKAYEQKNWANMSNFTRLYALIEQGGVYLDTDVKLLKCLDVFCDDSCFLGFEEGYENSDVFWVNNAICGSVKGHPFIKECFDWLLSNYDGTEMANLSGPRLTTNLLKQNRGLERYGNILLGDIRLYTKEFFYPIHYSEVYKLSNIGQHIYPETAAVHVWARSWLSKSSLLNIIDDLYKLNHEYSRQIKALPSSIPATHSSELWLGLQRIIDGQYFSRVIIEEFLLSLNDFKLQLSKKTKEVEFIECLYQGLVAAGETLSKNNVKAGNRIAFLEANLKMAEDKNELINKNYNDALTKALLTEFELSELRKVTQENKDRAENFQSQLLQRENEVNDLKEALRTTYQKLLELEITERAQLSTIRQLEGQYEVQTARFSELITTVQSGIKENSRLTEKYESAYRASLLKERELKDLEEQLNTSMTELSDTHARIRQMETEKDTVGQQLFELSERERINRADHQHEVNRLRTEVKQLSEAVRWYKATYENRKLAGIIKDRAKRVWQKSPVMKEPTLVERISEYIHNNPLTVKHNSRAEKVSVIMLSYNRIEDTKKAVQHLYANTRTPFELIILDNNSTDSVRKELKSLASSYPNLRVILETSNLGCARGRIKAARYAETDYLLFLDNDILVSPYYLENLFSALYSDAQVAGVCCKVVFPDGNIQFNGGKMILDDQYALYSLYDEGLKFDDPATNTRYDCEWIPGGATLWKKDVLTVFEIDDQMKGSFEDNEISYRLKSAGYKLHNSPASIVIHDHFDFKSRQYKENESAYFAGRNDPSRIKDALLHFYKKHNLIFSFAWKNNPWDIFWKLHSKEQILQFIHENKP